MYDVEALEREWKKYRRKRWIPWIAMALFISFLLIYLLFRVEISPSLKKHSVKNSVPERRSENSIEQKSSDRYPAAGQQAEIGNVVTEEENIEIDPFSGSEIQKTSIEKSDDNTKAYRERPKMAIELSDAKSEPKEHRRKYLKIKMTDRYPKKTKGANH